jgi:hypothetical protein
LNLVLFAGVLVCCALFTLSAQGQAVIYEPFDYAAGGLNGQSGSTEIGLDGTWSANSTTVVVPNSLYDGDLSVAGGSIGDLSANVNRFGGSRGISSAALADNGLLDDGATLWFSVELGYGTGGTIPNARLGFALANSSFSTGNYDFWIQDEGTQLGSGIGITLAKLDDPGEVIATEFRDLSEGDGAAGNVLGSSRNSLFVEGESGMIVGKIEWGATSGEADTLTLYQPSVNLRDHYEPISCLTMTVDQSTFDTITFARGDVVVLDEIRFGASFASVAQRGQVVASEEAIVLDALTALTDHIEGTSSLSLSEIETHKLTIDDNRRYCGYSDATIAACFDLVDAYDSAYGALFVLDSSVRSFTRADASDDDIYWAVFHVMQYTMDYAYGEGNLEVYEALLDGYKFGSSAFFPGAVAPPADPTAEYEVQISGTYADAWGHPAGDGDYARKPTGAYLAPGSIATVTVPSSLVGKGYLVRVGGHTWDLKNKPTVKRLDRVSKTYAINSTEVQVANPLGGGIYIEVPYLADAGVVTIKVKNAVRSPYFSAKSFHQTTLEEWQDVERHHPAPFADFQTDKFMMLLPTSYIYAWDDPATALASWDAQLDVVNDLMGLDRVRGRETLYTSIDVQMRGDAFYPGYPFSNSGYDPNTDYGGNATNNYHLSANPSTWTFFHELGHQMNFRKFEGEVESTVNLNHVAVHNRYYGESFDKAFSTSVAPAADYRSIENVAVGWMMTQNFYNEQPMEEKEKKYQHKGHAKFVDVARLFGWESVGRYFQLHSEAYELDPEAGWDKNGDTDTLILNFCEATGYDIRPLLRFWGIHPEDPTTLAAAVASGGYGESSLVYALLKRYQSLVPADNAAYQTFATTYWNRTPSIDGYQTESDHASIWDTYDSAAAATVRVNMQNVIDLYFPNGNPNPDFAAPNPDPMTWAALPAAFDNQSITMTATTATDAEGNGVQYYFTCTAGAGNDSGWQSSPTYIDSGLEPETAYSYAVKARDNAPDGYNETANSSINSATTYWVDPMVIYSETFDGDGTGALDGAAPSIGANLWDAKSDFINNDGTVNGGGGNGAWAGAAMLPFEPETNQVYTLSVDLLHTGNEPIVIANLKYLALGFTKDGINYAQAGTGNRIPSKNGIAWFQYGHGGTVVTYGGLNALNEIANTGTYVGGTFINLKVIIDTTGDGTSFTADFLIDDTSIVGGPQTVALAVDDINYAALGSYGTRDGDSPIGSIFDNFELRNGTGAAPTDVGDISIEITGGMGNFSWYGEAGQTYGLEVTDDLTSGSWDTVANVVGTNGLISLTAAMDQTNAFYRVYLAD